MSAVNIYSIQTTSGSAMPKASGLFKNIPDEITQYILGLLPLHMLARTQRVCKNFQLNAQQAIMRGPALGKLKKVQDCTLQILGTSKQQLNTLQQKECFGFLNNVLSSVNKELNEFISRGAGYFIDLGWLSEQDIEKGIEPLLILDKFTVCVNDIKELFIKAFKRQPTKTLSLYKQYIQMTTFASEKASSSDKANFNQMIAKEFSKDMWLNGNVTKDKLRAALHLYSLVNKSSIPRSFLENAIAAGDMEAVLMLLKSGVEVDKDLFSLAEKSKYQEIRKIFKEYKAELGYDDSIGEKLLNTDDPLDIFEEALFKGDTELISRLMSQPDIVLPNLNRFMQLLNGYMKNETNQNKEIAKIFIYGLDKYFTVKEAKEALERNSAPKWMMKYVERVFKQAFEDRKLSIAFEAANQKQ